MNGFLNVYKPSGVTSFSVVAAVRRILGVRRAGHLGTLDPAATGVLPVAIGDGTRLIEYVGGDKSYRAVITLGVTTDSLDATGTVTAQADPGSVTLSAVHEALTALTGLQQQVPPMASAVHLHGKRLYELFRAGKEVDVPARPVRVDRLALQSFDNPTLVIDVDCGPGTYVRSLARDLGERLGCGAHLAALERTRSGPFQLGDAHSLEAIREAATDPCQAAALLVPFRQVLCEIPWIVLTPGGLERVRHGGRIGPDEVEDASTVVAPAKDLELAVGRTRAPHPGARVLATADGIVVAVGTLDPVGSPDGDIGPGAWEIRPSKVLASGLLMVDCELPTAEVLP